MVQEDTVYPQPYGSGHLQERRGEELLLLKYLHIHLANIGISFCSGEMILKIV